MTTTTEKRTITISGNWREDGPDNEWAGSGLVDHHGHVECSADLGDDAYEAIEDQIAEGDTSGSVTVHSEELGRDVTYNWEIE